MSGHLAKADAVAWLGAHVWSRQGHRGPSSSQHRGAKRPSCVSASDTGQRHSGGTASRGGAFFYNISVCQSVCKPSSTPDFL